MTTLRTRRRTFPCLAAGSALGALGAIRLQHLDGRARQREGHISAVLAAVVLSTLPGLVLYVLVDGSYSTV
jgi:hypothetical protein